MTDEEKIADHQLVAFLIASGQKMGFTGKFYNIYFFFFNYVSFQLEFLGFFFRRFSPRGAILSPFLVEVFLL